MNSNREIGFDILENSDISSVEEIGTEKMNIDKKARDRMLKITMDKYAEASGKPVKGKPSSEVNDYSDHVSGTDRYEHHKLSHIIYFSACSAAAVALIAGGVFVFRHNDSLKNSVSEPAGEIVTTTVTKAVSETDDPLKVTEAAAPEQKQELIEDSELVYVNPHTDRTDITQEELEAAIKRAPKLLYSDDEIEEFDLEYAVFDVNKDGISELFIRDASTKYLYGSARMLVYNGKNYEMAYYYVDLDDERYNFSGFGNGDNGSIIYISGDIKICPEKQLIYVNELDDEGVILKFEEQNTMKTLYSYGSFGYYEGSTMICQEPENAYPEMYNRFKAAYDAYTWQELEYMPYEKADEPSGESNEEADKQNGELNEEADEPNGDLVEDSMCVYNNIYTDRTDITEEELIAALKDVPGLVYDREEIAAFDLKYAFEDLNDDDIPELFMKTTTPEGYIKYHMMIYNGKDFELTNYESGISGIMYVCGDKISICPEKNLIYIGYNNNYGYGEILKMEEKNTMKSLYAYSDYGYSEGGVEAKTERFKAVREAYNWQELEYKSFEK